MKFKRFRRHRINEVTRLKYRETFLKPADFIWPVFIVPGKNIKQEIPSMSGVFRYSNDKLIAALNSLISHGLKSILLFGVPKNKGLEQSYADNGIVQSAIPLIKRKYPKLEIITDVCLCSYTNDGHCHIGDNDKTCAILAKIALSHARAGADLVAPSAMMDGQVKTIRQALDNAGFRQTRILSYAAKFSSNFYGPFRLAAECAPKTGDRQYYQMDPANAKEALEEIAADIEEGAAQIMIKPALSYLDIIARAKGKFEIPIVAYNVSGEYQMIKSAIENKILAGAIIEETLLSIKRAGADRIVSYFTPEVLRRLKHE